MSRLGGASAVAQLVSDVPLQSVEVISNSYVLWPLFCIRSFVLDLLYVRFLFKYGFKFFFRGA